MIRAFLKFIAGVFVAGVIVGMMLGLVGCTMDLNTVDREQAGEYRYNDNDRMVHVITVAKDDTGVNGDAFTNDAIEVAQTFHCELARHAQNHTFTVMLNVTWLDIKERVVGLNLRANDLLIFHYSGHGTIDEYYTGKGITLKMNCTGFDGSVVVQSEELIGFFESLPSKSLLLVSSCYSGQVVESAKDSNKVCVIASGKANETTYSGFVPKLHNHSFFASALLDIMGWECGGYTRQYGMHGKQTGYSLVESSMDIYDRLSYWGNDPTTNGVDIEFYN